MPNDYTLEDAALELLDNSLEASYHKGLELHKPKAIFLTYGNALDSDALALDIFDGGIGMAGMDSSTGGIAAWATLVSRLAQCFHNSCSAHQEYVCWSSQQQQLYRHAWQHGAAIPSHVCQAL